MPPRFPPVQEESVENKGNPTGPAVLPSKGERGKGRVLRALRETRPIPAAQNHPALDKCEQCEMARVGGGGGNAAAADGGSESRDLVS